MKFTQSLYKVKSSIFLVMVYKKIGILCVFANLIILTGCKISKDVASSEGSRFNLQSDFLLVHYDCKTDVDDLHSIAAFKSLSLHQDYKKLKYHAVAGAYGIQEGLYVPPNEIFNLCFENNWTDAHDNQSLALEETFETIRNTLQNGGSLWIAEAGQSDFSALLVKKIFKMFSASQIKSKINVVQHSDWNESVTSPAALDFLKDNINYYKIPDGNALGNGSPGFNTSEFVIKIENLKQKELQQIWESTLVLANQYNGKDARYLNKTIAAGGLDFSDTAEVCFILEVDGVDSIIDFFDRFLYK